MLRTLLIAAIAATAPALLPADEKSTGGKKAPALRLTKADLGKLPANWKAEQTGKGAASVWKVEADATAPSKSGFVLTQTAKAPRSTFNLCVADNGSYRDVEVKVHFKALRGKDDQGGGIVWRYQGPRDYYVARMNPLEDNFRLYKVVAGRRIQLATEEPVQVKPGTWNELSIRHVGDRIVCHINGKHALSATDNTIKTAGKVGLWTKADAVTSFDQFLVREVKK
jgi:hypothetical protein